ncbi:YafY family protein [Branchiibius sp. NY16-3462-2]|uniref:helix-turn-helix transcriptional regulator n=1 Tax=Branchiibius sp. NY16-3462-2 TaxID=1807500 RepID=UPI000797E1DF|nr:WYL domain-containing protein [Branchiibius sp. NY16-3462-2]KYH46260.1 DNA-binding protein [Branchiibius sp. NY16-3462-2]
MDESNPTVRSLRTLQLLQDRPGISAEELARRLDCSDRAARRYVSILREAGIPVFAIRGRYGGYRLGSGVRLPPVTFTAAEALGLVMAVLDGHHAAGDDTAPVGAALAKVVRAMPASVAGPVETIRRWIAPAPDRGAARPDPAITIELVQAWSQQRVVRITYCSERGTTWTTEVEPWAIVVRHGRWYLLCRDRGRDAMRAYRVDRITEPLPLIDTFEPPVDLDPVQMLEEHLATGWEYAAEVLIHAPIERVRRCVSPAWGRLTAEGDMTRLTGTTDSPYFYAEQLATLPWSFEVVGSEEVRSAVREVGQRLVAATTP